MIILFIIILVIYYSFTGYRTSSINNPVGNPTIVDKNLKLESGNINYDNLKYNFYQDSNKPYLEALIKRCFYSMPVTTYPNNTKKSREFIYQHIIDCKSDADKCYSFRDERGFNRYIPKRKLEHTL
jgi:hypothetical protein